MKKTFTLIEDSDDERDVPCKHSSKSAAAPRTTDVGKKSELESLVKLIEKTQRDNKALLVQNGKLMGELKASKEKEAMANVECKELTCKINSFMTQITNAFSSEDAQKVFRRAGRAWEKFASMQETNVQSVAAVEPKPMPMPAPEPTPKPTPKAASKAASKTVPAVKSAIQKTKLPKKTKELEKPKTKRATTPYNMFMKETTKAMQKEGWTHGKDNRSDFMKEIASRWKNIKNTDKVQVYEQLARDANKKAPDAKPKTPSELELDVQMKNTEEEKDEECEEADGEAEDDAGENEDENGFREEEDDLTEVAD